MSDYELVEGILGFAIEEEEKAARLYQGLAEEAENESSRMTYEEMAREERKHKLLLQEYRDQGRFPMRADRAESLGVTPGEGAAAPEELEYPEILLYAIRCEHEAKRMYESLAEITADESIRSALELLAAEEARHQFRLEAEYMAATGN